MLHFQQKLAAMSVITWGHVYQWKLKLEIETTLKKIQKS